MADGLAIGVQTIQRLSLIPGWAGFAALEPELGVEHKGGPTGPPIFLCWQVGRHQTASALPADITCDVMPSVS